MYIYIYDAHDDGGGGGGGGGVGGGSGGAVPAAAAHYRHTFRGRRSTVPAVIVVPHTTNTRAPYNTSHAVVARFILSPFCSICRPSRRFSHDLF